MKKIVLLIAFVFLFTACEKDNLMTPAPAPKPTPKNPVIVMIDNPNVHSYSKHINVGEFNLFRYQWNTRLKSTTDTVITVNDTLMYVDFKSFYSTDFGQRNVHEIEVYSGGVNVAINQVLFDYEQTIDISMYNLNDKVREALPTFDFSNYPVIYTNSEDKGGDIKEFINDGNLNTRWASIRNTGISCDTTIVLNTTDSLSIHNDTIYAYYEVLYPDTIDAVINLRKSYVVDSIKLYLGEWKQTFDLLISNDSTKWNKIVAPSETY